MVILVVRQDLGKTWPHWRTVQDGHQAVTCNGLDRLRLSEHGIRTLLYQPTAQSMDDVVWKLLSAQVNAGIEQL